MAEIAETLKVNQQTVRNWIDRGELKGVRVGTAPRPEFRRHDFDDFIESGGSEHDQVEPPVPAGEGLAAAVQVAQQAIESGSNSRSQWTRCESWPQSQRDLLMNSPHVDPPGGVKDDGRR